MTYEVVIDAYLKMKREQSVSDGSRVELRNPVHESVLFLISIHFCVCLCYMTHVGDIRVEALTSNFSQI